MNEVSKIKHRTGHSQGEATSQALYGSSTIFCTKSNHGLFHNDWPHGEGHQVSQELWYPLRSNIEFLLLPELMDIIQLMPNLNHPLHSGAHEAVDRGEPSMSRASTRD